MSFLIQSLNQTKAAALMLVKINLSQGRMKTRRSRLQRHRPLEERHPRLRKTFQYRIHLLLTQPPPLRRIHPQICLYHHIPPDPHHHRPHLPRLNPPPLRLRPLQKHCKISRSPRPIQPLENRQCLTSALTVAEGGSRMNLPLGVVGAVVSLGHTKKGTKREPSVVGVEKPSRS